MTQPIRVPKTAELVATHLRRQIVRGVLKEGDSLPSEGVLMEQFGISRPTLREAFRVLESESLISIRRGSRGGAQVHIPTVDVAARYAGLLLQVRGVTLGDVYRARLIIEPPAAGLLASKKSKATAKALRRALEDEEATLGDPAEFGHATTRFHELVVELAGNATLGVFVEMISGIIDLHTEVVIAQAAGSPTQGQETRAAHRAHARLVDLVEAGKLAEAEAYWRQHLEAIGAYLMKGQASRTVVELFG